ncbi:MAG: M16 family metallopeptidase [Prevotella sp.]
MAIHTSTSWLNSLPQGLRVIHLPSDSQVVYCGIAVSAGTRNERGDQQGMAHFCEHLAFKGTARRSARRIINDIEGLGGELNAFTNKEDTVFYCAIQRQHLRKAIDVLLDIVYNSTYPQQEVEKEREVVCDEIESYEDSPAELIYDEFENILFEGHPLGHNILGTSQQVRSYTADDARRFTHEWYRPENSVLFIAGPRPFTKGYNAPLPPYEGNACNQAPLSWEEVKGGHFVRHRNTHQAHVMLGSRAYAANDDRRWALYLLNNLLGGPSMNSRLSLSLRERHGLVYTVDSSMTSYSDTGLWAVYFGCDPADVDRCLRLVRKELDLLMQKPLSQPQLRAAKRQLQGQLAIACDNREQFTLDFARNFLHTGHGRTLADVMAHIDSLTADDLLTTARQLFAHENITKLIYL